MKVQNAGIQRADFEAVSGSGDLPQFSTATMTAPNVASDPNARPTNIRRTPTGLLWAIKMPVVAAAFTALAFTGCAAHGQTLEEPVVVRRMDESPMEAPPENVRYHRLLSKLEQRRDAGQITQLQFQRGKQALLGALVSRNGSILPLDYRGRVDLDVLVEVGATRPGAEAKTRGQIVFDRLGRQLELRMRVTARDMASGEFVALDGAPGYKQIEGSEVRSLIFDALQDVPLNELTGGKKLAAVLTSLPNAGHIDAENMSFREVTRAIGDANEDYAKAKFAKLVDGHELEVGIVAFAAVTGLRAASPDAAALMDKLGPRSTIWRDTSPSGHSDGRIRLAYRDQHIYPDIDIEGRTRWMIGDTAVRAGLMGTFSTEADDVFSATATVGARRQIGAWWVDASGSYRTDVDHWNARLQAGTYDLDSGWNFSTGVNATFGDGVAVGDAEGRVQFETDLTREFEFGHAVGDFGFFTGAGIDSDGGNEDIRGGLVFRLRF